MRTLLLILLCIASVGAQASLLGRAPLTPGGSNYQAYYDTALDITWLADANLAASNTFGAPRCNQSYPNCIDGLGFMNWLTAKTWIAAMNNANYLGVNNWRLPLTLQPDTSCQYQLDAGSQFPLQGVGACSGSEMGYLFNVEGISGYSRPPFTNIVQQSYWSDTRYAPDPTRAWVFSMTRGDQDPAGPVDFIRYYAWAVSPGDISAVPIPAAAWLFGGALGSLRLVRRRAS